MKILSFKGVLLLAPLLTALLLIPALNSNPHLFMFLQKKVGSFEYIRMGEKFLDKGIYDKAINYYEKAYDSSPENETILSGLVFVYTKYAFILADSRKFDEAIEYLTKAYNVKQNPSTIQNLAVMYTMKALNLAEKGDFSKAVNLYREAGHLAQGSYSAAKNLAVLLFNDGVDEYKKGREDIALLCLRESLSLYQDSNTFGLLGDIYYRRTELRKALFCWHRAKQLKSTDACLSAKLKRIIKEIKLAKSQKNSELAHFEIRYKKDLPVDRQLAAMILERAYLDVGKNLDYFPKAKTEVFFYSIDDFKSIFKMPAVVRAFYDGNIRIPIPDSQLGSEEFFIHIYHEYTHALLSAKTMNNCPVWFSEGIAMWEEFSKSGRGGENFLVNVGNIDNITLDLLDKEFEKNEITPNRVLYYFLSYTVVKYIIDNWGVRDLQDILKRLANKQHIVNAIDDEFLLSQKEFERRWHQYVKDKYLPK